MAFKLGFVKNFGRATMLCKAQIRGVVSLFHPVLWKPPTDYMH